MPSWYLEEKKFLEEMLAEAKALRENTVRIKTEGERSLVIGLIRLIETLLNGKPQTPPHGGHHQ